MERALSGMIKILLVFIFFIVTAAAEARGLRLIYNNNKGVVHALLQKNQEALDQFVALTAQDPDDLMVKFNIAATLNSLGEFEKSIKLNTTLLREIEEKLKTADSDSEKQELINLKFAALFNRGVSYQLMENKTLALESYQGALALSPDSKEIKTNIEMMFSGNGGGKGKDKNKQNQDGKGEGEPEDSEGEQEQQETKEQQSKDQKDQQQKKQPKEFDQKYMSNEDLKRIMEELKDQEQKIRAKMDRQGGKNADGKKDKEW